MYNIKIKSVPNRAKTGQQLDYSLVDRNTLFLKPDTQVQSDVKNTISAVPRDKANIEAEGGETIIGDTNNDGFLEHQTIVGKRHSKGGVPLNVPEGSFIFSDTDKLKIKDPEILKMFGMSANKKGYTPAEIAKKYQVNDYMAILKDDTKDKYSKETAQVMLDSNLKKLGMLALVQESMKGFPDGVPAIAESVMEGMMGGGSAEQQEEEQQGQPQARYGGLTKYQTKGEVKDTYAATYLQNNSDADLSDPFFKNVIKPGETHFDTNLNRQVPNFQTPAEYRYSIENNNWRGDGDSKGQHTLMNKNDYDILTEINDDNYNSVTSNKTKYTADERLATAMKYYKQNQNKGFNVPEVYSANNIDRQGTKDAQGNYINLPASKELLNQYDHTLTRRYGGTQLPKAQFGVPLPIPPIPTIIPTDKESAETAKDKTATTKAEPNWNFSEDTMYTAPGTIPLDEVVIRQQKLSAIPKIGDVYYVNGQPIKVSDIEMSSTGDWLPNWLNDPQGIYFSPQGTTDYDNKNKKYYLTFDEFKALRKLDPETGNAPVLRKHGRTASSWWTADNNRAYNFSTVPTSQPTRYYGSRDNNIAIDQNDILELPNGRFKVIDTQYGVGENNPLLAPERFLGVPSDLYNEKIRAKNLTTGQVEELRLDELKEKFDAGFAKNLTKYPEAADINPGGTPTTGEWTVTGNDSTTTNSMGVDEQVKSKEVGKPKPAESKPASVVKKQTSSLKTDTSLSPFIIDTSGEEQKAYGGSIYKMQVGGTPRFNSATGMYQNYDAQGKPVGTPYKAGTTYNVRDKELLDKAAAAGYEIIGNKYAPNVSYIPEQTSKTGFTWNPESGYYESKQFPVGKQGLDETTNNWKDELEQYNGPSGKGVEAWRKDFISQKGQEGPASKYLVDKANEYSVAAGFGPQVDVTQEDAYVPGQDVFTLKKFKKAPAQVAQTTTPASINTTVDVQEKTITPSIVNKTRGWFTPDVLNLANAFGRKIGNFPPTLQQVDFQTGPYNLLSPEGEIAKIQSTGNMLSNQAANTMAGNVAFGAGLGVQGQAIDKVTDTQGKYSNANVGISNEASRYGSGVANQEALANAELRSKFNQENAIYGQQRVNAENAKMLGMTKAFNQGWGNAFKGNILEDMFPQVGIDRVYGDIGYSGEGRNPFGVDTYINPLTAAASAKGNKGYADDWDDDDWKQISAFTNKGIENGLSKDQAYSLASKIIMAKKSRNNTYDPYNPGQAMAEGLGNMF